MTLRDDLLPVFNDARTIISGFGLRDTTVIIRKQVFASGKPGVGAPTVTDTTITPNPKVVPIGISAEGRDMFEIQKIMPKWTGGGYDPQDLVQPQPEGSLVFVVLDGPAGRSRECRIAQINERKNFEYVLIVEARQ